LLLVTLTTFSLRTFAFDPQFYTSTLTDRGVFQDFEHDPLKYIDLTAQFSQLKTLSADTQRQIITAALPPGWLAQSLKNALQAFFDWFKSDAPPPAITIDLRPIKDRLQGPPGADIAREVVAAIPTCAAGQQPSFDRLPECWPANLDHSLIVEQVAQVLDSAASDLPPSIDIGGQLVRGSDASRLVEVRQWTRGAMVDVGAFVLAAAPLFIWLIGALIGGRYSKERLTWLGGWLLFGALTAVGVYALIFVGGTRAVLSSAITLPDGLTSAAAGAVQNLMAAILAQLVWRALIPVAGLLIVAVGLMGVGAANRQAAHPRR
jgi:hypothetical protein